MDGTVQRDPRGQGDQGERSAMLWFGTHGAGVFMPVFHSPDFDLVADFGNGLLKVQVKTRLGGPTYAAYEIDPGKPLSSGAPR